MRSSFKPGVVLLLIVLIATAYMQATQKELIDWRKSFDPLEKKPYGTFVLKQELKALSAGEVEIPTIDKSLYSFLEEEEYQQDAVIFYVGSEFTLDKSSQEKILQFLNDGGSLFIAAHRFNDSLLNVLGISVIQFDEHSAGVDYRIDETKMYLSELKSDTVVFDKMKQFRFFNKMETESTTVLGYAGKEDISVPNFVRIQVGKGEVYLHAAPEVFTNYYLLKKETFPIAYVSLQNIKGKEVLWFDSFFGRGEETSPLRFIVSNTYLSSAWYLLLLMLILYLVFKSKREQRAIPVIEPEPNLSIDFAKTIGSLYYENKVPGNMVLKKIEYFLFDIRKNYHLDTQNLSDKKFIKVLAQRTALPESEVRDFLAQLETLQNQTTYSIQNLRDTYFLIEQFKQKATIL